MLKTPINSQTASELSLINHFLTNSTASLAAYREAIATAQEVLIKYFASQTQPYSGAHPERLAIALATNNVCSETGQDLRNILKYVGENILKKTVVFSHPRSNSQFNFPPQIPALSAEDLISASNQSMDSWDQSRQQLYWNSR